jgi:hypothetical protein
MDKGLTSNFSYTIASGEANYAERRFNYYKVTVRFEGCATFAVEKHDVTTPSPISILLERETCHVPVLSLVSPKGLR